MSQTAPREPRHPMAPRQIVPSTDLGRRMMAFVEARGYASLKAASEGSGVNYQQLWDIVAKGKDPRVSTLERIVEAMGGTMAEFYGPSA